MEHRWGSALCDRPAAAHHLFSLWKRHRSVGQCQHQRRTHRDRSDAASSCQGRDGNFPARARRSATHHAPQRVCGAQIPRRIRAGVAGSGQRRVPGDIVARGQHRERFTRPHSLPMKLGRGCEQTRINVRHASAGAGATAIARTDPTTVAQRLRSAAAGAGLRCMPDRPSRDGRRVAGHSLADYPRA